MKKMSLPPLTSASLEVSARSMALVAVAHERARAVTEQLEIARQRMSASKELMSRASAMTVLPFLRPIGATELDETVSGTAGSPRTFAAVTELIKQVERSTPSQADIVSGLVAEILLAARSLPDSSLLVGIFLQAIVQTVHERFSAAEQRQTAIALCTLLWDHIMEGRSDTTT